MIYDMGDVYVMWVMGWWGGGGGGGVGGGVGWDMDGDEWVDDGLEVRMRCV